MSSTHLKHALRTFAFTFAIASAGVARGEPTTQPGGDDLTPRWRVVARWYGSFDDDVVRYATREPGLFGMALSGAHFHQVSRGHVVLHR